jgi:hypothetical protein
LTVDLYVFSRERATAPHFKVESCTRPNIAHPLLHHWVGDLHVATKLTATLSPEDMRNDVWLDLTPFFFEQKNRLFSQQGALTTALNWGAELFIVCLIVCFFAFASEKRRAKLPRWIGIVAIASIALAGLSYLCLPKIEVKLVKVPSFDWSLKKMALNIAMGDFNGHTAAEARTNLQEIISNPTNAMDYGIRNRDNYFVGGQFREEDSPGNYLLRETNSQLELIFFNPDGGEEISGTWDLHPQPLNSSSDLK